MFCKHCGAPNPEGAKFCGECGTENVEMSAPLFVPAVEQKESLTCKKCGKVNKHSARFCSGCGDSLIIRKIKTESPEEGHASEIPNHGTRKILLILIAAAILVSLFTAAWYSLGFRPVLYTVNISGYFNEIHTTNVWVTEKYLKELENPNWSFGENKNQIYDLMDQSVDAQVKSMVLYYALTIGLILSFVLLLKRNKISNFVTLMFAITGFAIIFVDYYNGQEIMLSKKIVEHSGTYQVLPQISTLLLFPVLAVIIIFALVSVLETVISRKRQEKLYLQKVQNRSIKAALCIIVCLSLTLCYFVIQEFWHGFHPSMITYSQYRFHELGVDSFSDYLNMDMYCWMVHNSIYLPDPNGPFLFEDFGTYSGSTFHFVVAGAYFCLIVLLLISILLILLKSANARIIAFVTGVYGVCVIAIEFVVGYFILRHNYTSLSMIPDHYVRYIPQVGTLILLPLVAAIAIASFVLPKNDRK